MNLIQVGTIFARKFGRIIAERRFDESKPPAMVRGKTHEKWFLQAQKLAHA